jgi:peptidoglycan/xylan/chitin deacetylase (PgdA/CDA1 family)/SAM-dependent methyltransferase
MRTRLAIVLQGVPGLRSLVLRLEELNRQTRRPDQILLLDSGGLGDRLSRLGDTADRLSLPEVEPVDASLDAHPSVWRDIGMRSSKTEVVCFLEPGVRLKDRYFERALEPMASKKIAFVTSWWERVGPSGESEHVAVDSCDLPVLLARPDAVHRATLFSRAAWKKTGGFDMALAAAEDYELCLRLLGEGWRAALVSEELVRQEPDRLSSFQRDLWRERYVPAMTAIFNKHRDLFEQESASVLLGREETLIGLADRYRPIVSRREAAVRDLDALKQEIADLTRALREHGHDRVDWGDLRRTKPISPEWGYDRGKPIDRYYIEGFLEENARHVRGRVLEIQEDDYSRRFGGEDVESIDVVDACATNPRANVIADLRRTSALPEGTYDCIILTQTIHVIDDMEAVARECFRLLKPGGTLLVTLPCLSRVCLEYGPDGDYWRTTEAGARQLFSAAFPPYAIETRVYGNVLAGTAFTYGLCCDEVTPRELDETDPYNPTLIGVCATKPADLAKSRSAAKRASVRVETNGAADGIILAYHGVTPGSEDPHGLFIEPKVFAQQMAHLRTRYRPMSLPDLVAGAQNGSLPPRAVAVTFDDGYRDALTTISPILVRNKIPATFFVTTSSLAEGSEHWWDLLARIFFTAVLPSRELAIELEGETRRFFLGTRAEIGKAHWALHQVLVRSPLAERSEILRRLVVWSGIDSRPPVRQSMTANEVKTLARRPRHTIGAHSVHHLALGHQSDETQQQEVMECKAALERLALSVDAFAYPYGDFNAESVRLVRAAGFRLAVTCEERSVPARPDPFRLPRLEVKPGSIADFKSWLGERAGKPSN